ncbi:GNAT family N-acetyltransferase [Paenibacillus hamazuiensis]|uniref:GNAT family N-acetyltransferase n=1 Tax=Paenibacillus hamazuiensis TaxID=2936508 RepID=UPI00200F6C15|nr:GNAT family N-acetyltransferase [Paenibacillus hamazuiensis]
MIPKMVKTDEELQQCLRIRQKVFVEEQGVDPAIEIDELDASPAACRHLLLADETGPIATGRMRPYDASAMKLQRIAVLPEHRGTGAGRAIVLAMEEQARKLGFSHTVLDAQVQAEPFYRKLGYETVSSETFLDAGIPHVRMKKQILFSF